MKPEWIIAILIAAALFVCLVTGDTVTMTGNMHTGRGGGAGIF
ncbi:hypothetical protein [Bradyrhizobium sp. SRS-191]|nr:hypothetical protein [Bradyrhizobium sp. SRS-191]